MKFKVMMKDPDTLHDAIEEAVKAEVSAILGVDDEDRPAMEQRRREAVTRITSEWFKWGEYLTVEIDTDERTAVVLRA